VKVRVPITGTVGKAVFFDPEAGARAEAAVAALAAQISAGIGGTVFHSSLRNLQVGDDHPQYAGWQFPETIVGQWNFQTIPQIQGETLAEYIQDVVGADFFDFLQDTSSVVWTYAETANELEANVPPEFVQDTVGAMLTTTSSIALAYDDPAGTLSAATINANPTGIIGLAAVNGTAATPMRSDAAPALSQAITPTWTNTHTFNNTPVVPNDSWTYAKIQDVSATSRVLGRISSGAGDIEELTGANLATILGSAIPSGANPTASVGLSAVNGSATSFMRSDGAPALSQSITPTWSGAHAFSAQATFTAGLSGANGALKVASTVATLYFDDTDGGVDNRLARIVNNAGVVGFQFANDAGAGQSAYEFTRSGNQATQHNFYIGASVNVGRFDNSATAGHTRLLVWDVDNGALERVSVGVADSGGAGFKVLRIPN
jgi:hypothetical protein